MKSRRVGGQCIAIMLICTAAHYMQNVLFVNNREIRSPALPIEAALVHLHLTIRHTFVGQASAGCHFSFPCSSH